MNQHKCHCQKAKKSKKKLQLPCLAGGSFLVLAVVFFVLQAKENAILAQNNTSTRTGSNPEMASRNAELLKGDDQQQSGKHKLLREGSYLRSQKVMFRISDNRSLLLMPDSHVRLICLENLNLERITHVIQENPTLTDWEVDFIITEYQGTNYALIQKAVLSSNIRR